MTEVCKTIFPFVAGQKLFARRALTMRSRFHIISVTHFTTTTLLAVVHSVHIAILRPNILGNREIAAFLTFSWPVWWWCYSWTSNFCRGCMCMSACATALRYWRTDTRFPRSLERAICEFTTVRFQKRSCATTFLDLRPSPCTAHNLSALSTLTKNLL